jgi:hypothetical protein
VLMVKERENSKLKTLRTISAGLFRIAGRAGLLRLLIGILDRVLSIPMAANADPSLGPSGIGPHPANERGLRGGISSRVAGRLRGFGTAVLSDGHQPITSRRYSREPIGATNGALPGKFNVSGLISLGLGRKRAFFATFLTLNHLDFS